MDCKACGEETRMLFSAEMALVPLGEGILVNEPVYMTAKPVVCLKCGFTEFVVPRQHLQDLEDTLGASPQPVRRD